MRYLDESFGSPLAGIGLVLKTWHRNQSNHCHYRRPGRHNQRLMPGNDSESRLCAQNEGLGKIRHTHRDG